MSDSQLLGALDLLRRLPPSRMEATLEELVDLVPQLTDDLLNSVDQPLQVAKDAKGANYLLCEYNRDGDSYRSPWTNAYDPPTDEGVLASDKCRNLEMVANDVFDGYRETYYEGGCSSVYVWDLDDFNFAACVAFKCDVEEQKKGLMAGQWDAVHVVEVRVGKALKGQPGKFEPSQYKVTSTIQLRLSSDHIARGYKGALHLSGTLTRQREETKEANDLCQHVSNMGRIIEDMENQMREALQNIYFSKTKTVVNGMYMPVSRDKQREDLQRQLKLS